MDEACIRCPVMAARVMPELASRERRSQASSALESDPRRIFGAPARVRKVHHSYSDAGLHRLASYGSLNTAGESSATHREYHAKRDKRLDSSLEHLKTILPLSIGVGLAFITQAMVSVESLIHHSMHLIEAVAMQSCSMGHCSSATWISAGASFVALRMAIVLLATLLTMWEPNAAGSGMSAVKSNLNGADITNYLNLKTLLAKSVGVTLVVSTALPLGKEGPMVHIGACVASVLSGWAARVHPEGFHNPTSQRAWASLGAAAGIAAAFRSPLGGILYSFEEVASSWSMLLTWRAFLCVVAVSVSARFFREVPLALCGGGGGGGEASLPFACTAFLDHDIVIGLDLDDYEHFRFRDGAIPLVMLVGGAGGALGAAFNLTVRSISRRRMAWQATYSVSARRRVRLVEALLLSALTFILFFMVPAAFCLLTPALCP